MKHYFVIIALTLSTAFASFAQSPAKPADKAGDSPETDAVSQTDPIEVRKNRFTTSFYQKGEKLSTSLIQEVVVKNPVAVQEMQAARKNYLASIAFNTTGAFLLSYPIAASIFSGSRTDWKMVGMGAALVGVGIPFGKAYIRHAVKAADLHNQGLRNAPQQPEVKVGFTGRGLGLSLTF